jgi:hypothetical protein
VVVEEAEQGRKNHHHMLSVLTPGRDLQVRETVSSLAFVTAYKWNFKALYVAGFNFDVTSAADARD